MGIAVSATIATVSKKLLTLLLGDEKGRKFLLYVVGIVLFIISVPLITLLGMFGWMAGDSGSILNRDDILANLPDDQLVQIQTIDDVSKTIATTFQNAGLEEADQKKATAIYMGYLVGLETQDGFYENLTNCFLNTSESADIYDQVSQTFLVVVTEDDQAKFDSLYGVTPTRTTAEHPTPQYHPEEEA